MILRKHLPLLLSIPISVSGLHAQAPSGGGEKQPVHGLLTMGALTPLFIKDGHADNSLKEANAHPGVYSGVLILVSWDELEHVEGKLDVSRIETGLDAVRAYNKKYPDTPVKAKLRIFSGWNTPEWVIAKSGGGITIEQKGEAIAIGHFWTAAYRDSWKALQTLLAARYDDDPLMEEVAVSSCATVTAEPFVMPLTPENLPKLHAAGFSDAGFKACLLGAIDDYSSWKHTAIDYTFNPFRDTDGAQAVPDPAFPNEVMEAFRKRYGARAVIANHGLQPTVIERQTGVYAELKKLGPPIEFQTISPTVEWDASVANGLAFNATEIEVWNTKDVHGPAPVSYDQLKKWAAEMRAQPAR